MSFSGPAGPRVPRRRAIRVALAGGFLAATASALGIAGAFLRPRPPREFGASVDAGHVRDFPRGAGPTHDAEFRFWLANLDPSDADQNGTGGGAGLLACYDKCPHLGEVVDWRPEFEFNGAHGWYRCRKHGATYTRAGVRVFGPAPRSLDTMRVTVDQFGAITVHTGDIARGDTDNPKRAVQHPLLPS
ncbi:MAG: hypothetical protein EPO16_07245 [Dehalococcoidia bacterium]|nr:MAG: hypothetical protein EPO16_07245 [Dehalococcoidia bacterium]